MIAKKPPMGWNSWDCYGSAVTEAQVKANADYMAANMKAFGWEYVVVDIEWYQPTADTHEYHPFSDLCMDEYGRLLPAPNRFPSAADGKGFTTLAAYIHDLGLKFGIHIMRGMPRMAAHKDLPVLNSDYTARQVADPNSICAWNPDMYGLKCEQVEAGARAYYESIFRLYADWGVDFVKVDDIAREYPQCRREIELISESCRSCGRDIVLSLSPGPAPLEQAEHLKKYANMWRITDDFWDDWKLLKNMFERCELWQNQVSRGNYPDCDMLPVGKLGKGFGEERDTRFTKDEQRTMMTLWCLFGSPLMIGAELTKLDEWTLGLLTNKKVLSMLTPDCKPHQIARDDNQAAWSAHNEKTGQTYVALFNLSEEVQIVNADIESIIGADGRCLFEPDAGLSLEELWTGKVDSAETAVSAELAPHSCVVYEVK